MRIVEAMAQDDAKLEKRIREDLEIAKHSVFVIERILSEIEVAKARAAEQEQEYYYGA